MPVTFKNSLARTSFEEAKMPPINVPGQLRKSNRHIAGLATSLSTLSGREAPEKLTVHPNQEKSSSKADTMRYLINISRLRRVHETQSPKHVNIRSD